MNTINSVQLPGQRDLRFEHVVDIIFSSDISFIISVVNLSSRAPYYVRSAFVFVSPMKTASGFIANVSV